MMTQSEAKKEFDRQLALIHNNGKRRRAAKVVRKALLEKYGVKV